MTDAKLRPRNHCDQRQRIALSGLAASPRDPQDMRIIFVGRRNKFNRGIIHWLAQHYKVPAVFFIEENHLSHKARLNKLRKRVIRRGLLRVADEVLFRLAYDVYCGASEKRMWNSAFPSQFRSTASLEMPCFSCQDIHQRPWLEQIRDLCPDLLFGVCTHTFFKPSLYHLPTYGMVMLHEGLTPEYRGLHTAAWALLNGEPEYVGFTLLKIDGGVDTGPILCQGAFPDAEKYAFHFGVVGHLALIHGLPLVKSALDDLYRRHGHFEPVPTKGRRSRNYSWVGLSDVIRTRINRKRMLLRRDQSGADAPTSNSSAR